MNTAEMPWTHRSIIGVPSERTSTTRPRRRPPRWLRVLTGLLGLTALVFNALLMMSDRAPRLVRALGGDLVEHLSARIDADSGLRTTVAGHLPEGDFAVHVGVWGLAVLLAGVAVWTWRRLVLVSVALFAFSVFVEAAQGTYTETRSVEIDDVVANGIGVATGAVAVAGLYLAWSAAASLISPRR